MLMFLFLLLAHRSRLNRAIDNYVASLHTLDENKIRLVTLHSTEIRALVMSWQIRSLAFAEIRNDFDMLMNMIIENAPDVFALALQTDDGEQHSFAGAEILNKIIESMHVTAEFVRSNVASQKYSSLVVFARKNLLPEFGYKESPLVANSEMINVKFGNNTRKIGFLNSNFVGIGNSTAAEITRIVGELGLSRGTNRTLNVPMNTSDHAVVLWSGDFKTGIDLVRAKAVGIQTMYDPDGMAMSRDDVDVMASTFNRFWPPNCFEDATNVVPTHGYKFGQLSRMFIPGWPSRIIVFENVLEQPRKTVDYGVADMIATGTDKPLIGLYEFVI